MTDPTTETEEPEAPAVPDPRESPSWQAEEKLRVMAQNSEAKEMDWDVVEQALEVQAIDNGKRPYILAMAAERDPKRYSELAAKVIAPYKARIVARQQEAIAEAEAAKKDREKRALEANAKAELRIRGMVDEGVAKALKSQGK